MKFFKIKDKVNDIFAQNYGNEMFALELNLNFKILRNFKRPYGDNPIMVIIENSFICFSKKEFESFFLVIKDIEKDIFFNEISVKKALRKLERTCPLTYEIITGKKRKKINKKKSSNLPSSIGIKGDKDSYYFIKL